MARLYRGAETVMRVLDEPSPQEGGMRMQQMAGTGEGAPPEVECEVWYDLNGNPCAWSPVGAGVISVEIGSTDDNAPIEVYRALRDTEREAKAAEERIAELEEMVARLAAKMADDGGR